MLELADLEARLEQLLLTLRENAGALPAHVGLDFAAVALDLARALGKHTNTCLEWTEAATLTTERFVPCGCCNACKETKALVAWERLLSSLAKDVIE